MKELSKMTKTNLIVADIQEMTRLELKETTGGRGIWYDPTAGGFVLGPITEAHFSHNGNEVEFFTRKYKIKNDVKYKWGWD